MQILGSSPVSPHLQIHQLLQKAFGKTHFEIHLQLKQIIYRKNKLFIIKKITCKVISVRGISVLLFTSLKEYLCAGSYQVFLIILMTPFRGNGRSQVTVINSVTFLKEEFFI